jgi:hypothetical protein
MRDFERFGLICEEWLEAAKEEDSRSEEVITTSVAGVSDHSRWGVLRSPQANLVHTLLREFRELLFSATHIHYPA